jgi:FMN phosphatase YigB (HAD superfamily)
MSDTKKLLILDFDNTLFDWVTLWHRCFIAMTDEVTRISGIRLSDIQDEIRVYVTIGGQTYDRHYDDEAAWT